jgi:hypothetical protein
MSFSMASILIFDKNKKYLLYKILNKDILNLLINEFNKEYGENQNFQSLSPIPENQQAPHRPTTMLTDDFIYNYFAPIINSFEISKEMNYVYEYALFNKNQYIIRFTLYDNCLLLCIYSCVNSLQLQSSQQKNISTEVLELNKLVYNDYHTNWCSKSMISLIKYKFGICSDERCFNEIDNELENLFVKWSKLHSFDVIYFIESIEYLQVNDETRLKCDAFVKEFIYFIHEQEQIKLEFDYLDDEGLMANDYSDYDDDMVDFPGQNLKDNDLSNQYIDEIEDFFDDVSKIKYYMLSYGTKMLFKHDAILSTGQNSDFEYLNRATNNQTGQLLDSSSLFMILLEATAFLNYNIEDPFVDELECSFKSPTSTPSMVSVENDDLANEVPIVDSRKTPNSYIESFKSIKSTSTPMFSQNSLIFQSPIDELKELKLSTDIDSEIVSVLNESKLTENRIVGYKKTHCFLRNSNKSYNFYDVLFIKLDTNLCFTLLKLSKLTKYCEIITDLDTYLNELLIILNRKRLILTNIESDQKGLKSDETKTPSSQQQQQQQQQDESDEMKFLSVFINKLISFYEKLQILKNELNAQIQVNSKLSDISASSSTITSSTESTLKLENRKSLFKFSLLRQRLNLNRPKKQTANNKKSRLAYQRQKIVEVRLKQQLKLASSLQTKINQLINNKQFIPSLNLQALLATKTLNINQLLNNYCNIETQVIQLKQNLKDLLFDLFLSEKFTNKQQPQINNQQTPSMTPSTISSTTSSVYQLNSFNFINSVKTIFKKTNLHLYTSFMDVKMKRNLAMSYYWHQFPGLVHFSFINRHDNNCIVPTIEAYLDNEISETKINLAYRKYLPIIITFLYKYDCTQFQFIDSLLGIVVNYYIWFEDKNANYIPVDLNTTNQQQQQSQQQHQKQRASKNENILNEKLFRNRNNAYFNYEQKQHFPIGITLESYYDLLRKICYPNAPNESLSCYELICLHSITLNEKIISDQCVSLATILSAQSKKNK